MELVALWTLLLGAAAILTTNVVNAKRELKDTVNMTDAKIGEVIGDVISSESMIHYVFDIGHLSK